MLKKNTPVKFSRPMSTMRIVLSVIEQATTTRHEITAQCNLQPGQVKSALHNLVFIGAVIRQTDEEGRAVYALPGRLGAVAPCLCGVRSIFDVGALPIISIK
jgi:predicted transcriptional regulator